MLKMLEYCNPPTYENKTQGRCFVPSPSEFEWFINRNTFNGWIFQNHFDCVAAATAGAINSALGLTRNSELFLSARDINFALQYHEKQAIEINYQLLKSEYPDEDFSELFRIAVCFSKFLYFILDN